MIELILESLEQKFKELPFDFDCEFDANENWQRLKEALKDTAKKENRISKRKKN